MPPIRDQAFLVLAIAGILAFAAFAGEYWLSDAAFLAAMAGAVVYLSRPSPATQVSEDGARSMLTPSQSPISPLSQPRRRRTMLPASRGPVSVRGSRIAHYVVLSKLKSTKKVAKTTNSPFEQALLNEPKWQELSERELIDLSRREQVAPELGT